MNKKRLAIKKKMVELLFKNSANTSFYNLLLAVVVIYLIPNIDLLFLPLSTWFVIMIVAVFVRFISGHYYKKLNHKYAFYFQFGSIFVTGLLWGWLYLSVFDPSNQFKNLVIILLLTGVSAGSIVSMAPSRLCYIAFTLPMIISVIVTNILMLNPNSTAVIVLASIYYLYLVTLNRQNYNILFNNFNSDIKRGYLISTLNKKNQTDYLTELLNRKAFRLIAEKELEKVKESNQHLSLILCDIDYFKSINDKYGHHMGDEILKYVSSIFKKKFSQYSIARIGGDEFAILVTGLTTTNEIELVARNILNAISCEIPIKNYQIRISLSLGIASYPQSGNSIFSLERNADISLYKAKALGRNQYVMFSDELRDEYIKNELIYDAILQPFDNNFTFHYQPIYKASDDKDSIAMIELLLRSKIEFNKQISSCDILNAAEKRGLIIQFGFYALKVAFSKIKQLTRLNNQILFSVNISTEMIESVIDRNKLIGLIHYYDINPNKIILEITETSLVKCHKTIFYALNELKSYGFKIAIDDFGKDHSSLNRLSKLPADILKLDMEFTKEVADNFNVYTIVKFIIQLAKNLNLDIIAEGIETKEQYNLYKSLDCKFMQGFLLSKPIKIEELFTQYADITEIEPVKKSQT